VFYIKVNEGAPSDDGTSGADRADDPVAPRRLSALSRPMRSRLKPETLELWQSGHIGLQAIAIAALFLIFAASKKAKADNCILVRYRLREQSPFTVRSAAYCAEMQGRTVSAGERYRVMAAKMKAAAQVQADDYLRSEYENIASAYLVLADEKDAHSLSGWWVSANRIFNAK
jgi:hypothetical protein